MKRSHTETTNYSTFAPLPFDVVRTYVIKRLIPLRSQEDVRKTWYSLISFISTCKGFYETNITFVTTALATLNDKMFEINNLATPYYASLLQEYQKEMLLRENLREYVRRVKNSLATMLSAKWPEFEKTVEEDKEKYPKLREHLLTNSLSSLSEFNFIFTAYPTIKKHIEYHDYRAIDVKLDDKEVSPFHPFVNRPSYWWFKKDLFSKYARKEENHVHLNNIREGVFLLWSFKNTKTKTDNKTMTSPLQLKDGQIILEPYKCFKQAMKNYTELGVYKRKRTTQ
jgi:hypothetical protein